MESKLYVVRQERKFYTGFDTYVVAQSIPEAMTGVKVLAEHEIVSVRYEQNVQVVS